MMSLRPGENPLADVSDHLTLFLLISILFDRVIYYGQLQIVQLIR